MDRVGKYEVRRFSAARKNIVLVASEGRRKLKSDLLLEVDVTKARARMHAVKGTGGDVSFTGWIVKCLALAVSEHPALNSYRQGRRKIVVFEDVDVPVTVEREVGGDVRPLAHIVRRAQAKSLAEITCEIRGLQAEGVDAGSQVLGAELTGFERFVLGSPVWVRRLFVGVFRYRGLVKKEHFGTAAVTAIGMKGRLPGWVIPLGGPVTTLVAVGGISTKPGVVDGVVVPREFLHVTVTVDHAVVDGGPLTRFAERFVGLLESAAFLEQA